MHTCKSVVCWCQVTHETDARHLRDPAFLVRALRYRTGKLLFTVAQRLRKHTSRLGAFHGAAPDSCQPGACNHLFRLCVLLTALRQRIC